MPDHKFYGQKKKKNQGKIRGWRGRWRGFSLFYTEQ